MAQGLGRPERRLIGDEVLESQTDRIARAIEQLRAEQRRLTGLEQSHAQHEQVPGEVARVDGGHVGRPERLQSPRVVPVVEVATIALETGHRVQGGRDALHEAREGDVAQVERTQRREQLQPHVGGGGAPRDHRAGVLLEVVGRQVVALCDHEGVEEPPRLAGDSAQSGPVGAGQLGRLSLGSGQRQAPRPHRTGKPQRGKRQSDEPALGFAERRDSDEQHRRERGHAHHAPEGSRGRSGALLGIGRGLPLEQMLVRDETAPHGARGGVGVHPRVVRQHRKRQQAALGVAVEVTQHVRRVRTEAHGARAEDHRVGQREVGGEEHHEQQDERPAVRGLRQKHPAHGEQQQCRRRNQGPPQVVEDLPPADGVERVSLGRAVLAHDRRPQVRHDLPVAPDPPVHPRGGGQVVRRVVVEDLDVARERDAQERALDQIVAEKGVVREAVVEQCSEQVDLEDPLAGERALAEDVLVCVGHRARVGVDAGDPRVHAGETAAARALERHAHPRLHEPVARAHARLAGREARAVERVRDRGDQLASAVAGQNRVGVERDDERRRVAEVDVAELGGKRRLGLAAHLARELHQGAPLALPAHPRLDRLVVAPVTHEKVERAYAVLGLVALVELGDATDCGFDDLAVAIEPLRIGTLQIAEKPEGDVRIPVREIGDLEVLDDVAGRLHRREQRRHHHEGPVRVGHGLAEVELEQRLGRIRHRTQPVDHGKGDLGERDEPQHDEHEHAGRGSAVSERVPGDTGEQQRREQQVHPPVVEPPTAKRPAVHALAAGWRVSHEPLELVPALADEPPSHVAANLVRGVCGEGVGREGDDLLGQLELGALATPGHLLERVAVAVAAQEVHRRVRLRRIALQLVFDERDVLEELAPLEGIEEANARDRVGDGDLVGRPLLLKLDLRLVQLDTCAREPALQPRVDDLGAALDRHETLRETQIERVARRVRSAVEFGDQIGEAVGFVLRDEDEPLGPRVGLALGTLRGGDRGRQPSQVLHQGDAQHDGHRPRFTDRERIHALVAVDEVHELRLVEP